MAESIDNKTLYFMEGHGFFYSNSEQWQLREIPDNTKLPGEDMPGDKSHISPEYLVKAKILFPRLKGFYLRF